MKTHDERVKGEQSRAATEENRGWRMEDGRKTLVIRGSSIFHLPSSILAVTGGQCYIERSLILSKIFCAPAESQATVLSGKPNGPGLRQPSGALPASSKAVEDYRSPKRFAPTWNLPSAILFGWGSARLYGKMDAGC